jgi:hypothetical protein
MQIVRFGFLRKPFCSHNPLADIGLRSVVRRLLPSEVCREGDILERGSRQLQKGLRGLIDIFSLVTPLVGTNFQLNLIAENMPGD